MTRVLNNVFGPRIKKRECDCGEWYQTKLERCPRCKAFNPERTNKHNSIVINRKRIYNPTQK